MLNVIGRKLNGRLGWIIWRRLVATYKIQGFKARYSSDADSQSSFESYVSLGKGSYVRNSRIGFSSYIGEGTKIVNSEIGRYCSIGPDIIIGGLGRHPTNLLATHPAFYSKQNTNDLQLWKDCREFIEFEEMPGCKIGSDVWIGARSCILSGITVGDGAIIAAGAMVTKDVEPFSVVGGVPARKLKMRFSKETTESVVRTKWWNFSPDKLSQIPKRYFLERTDQYGNLTFGKDGHILPRD